jgi:hypothetical protein
MDVGEVRVSFRKTVSDGNYGNETYEVTQSGQPETEADRARLTEYLADLCRTFVVERLRRSANETVREALLTPAERQVAWRTQREARRAENAAWEAARRADHQMPTAMEDALDADPDADGEDAP